ncbi:PaaI family thioesterase [Mycolicibacterium moriokaense]|nr:PaaI family thioesterase [Mycolicibacterium moriokaense]
MATDPNEAHAGGGFNPPEPTTRGGPDYGRFVEAVRILQDHTRAADAPDDVVSKAADMVESVNDLLAPHEADEWTTPSGRRMDLPSRGNLLQVPSELTTVGDEVDGSVRFRRYHLGRNGAVHGGAVAQMWDSVLGFAAFRLTRSLGQRTAYLHVNYRQIVPIEKELRVDARVDRAEGRKVFVAGRLFDGDALLCDAEALFVKLKPGQP